MTAKERKYVLQKCKKEPLEQIVLTGAMIPFKFGSSDGLFNMGSALSYVQALP